MLISSLNNLRRVENKLREKYPNYYYENFKTILRISFDCWEFRITNKDIESIISSDNEEHFFKLDDLIIFNDILEISEKCPNIVGIEWLSRYLLLLSEKRKVKTGITFNENGEIGYFLQGDNIRVEYEKSFISDYLWISNYFSKLDLWSNVCLIKASEIKQGLNFLGNFKIWREKIKNKS